jgi:predicted transcriptional regulator
VWAYAIDALMAETEVPGVALLAAFLEKHDLTPGAFAAVAKVDASTIIKILRRQRGAGLDVAIAIANATKLLHPRDAIGVEQWVRRPIAQAG